MKKIKKENGKELYLLPENNKPNTIGNVTWKFMSAPAVPLSSFFKKDVIKVLKNKILSEAEEALKQQPVTVTAQSSPEVQVANMISLVKAITGGPIL